MQSPNNLWVTGEENGFPRPFGSYLLLAAFAQGGMGELFLAMNGSIAGAFRLCVVKKLRADLTNDKEYVNRFIDEARVVVQLNHANISHVFDIGRIEGQYYLAMEYVAGVSVKRLMSRAEELKQTIPEEIAVFIGREVLEALDYAHQHTHPITGDALHVVHRDVSPQNVLVSWAGEVKLIDFGLALSALKDEHTATGAVMGKVAYMPPEQARGDEVGASCDQFASAVVLYEMLAGERYHGDLPLHAIWAIAGMGNFPPPGWNKIARQLQVVIGKALQNDPERRYPTCGDLREQLGAYMAMHHPTTGERSLRDLLDNWFKEYRAQERELLGKFKDVTGAKIREAVKETITEAESLLSGPHKRPEAWQLVPPAEAASQSASKQVSPMPAPSALPSPVPSPLPPLSTPSPLPTPAPLPSPLPAPSAPLASPLSLALQPSGFSLPDGRLDESRSMRLMPPPAGASGPMPAALVGAAEALLAAPLAPPVLAPPARAPIAMTPLPSTTPTPPTLAPPTLNPMNTVGESTERFMRGQPGMEPLATLTPRAVVAESTERFMRGQSSSTLPPAGPVLTPLAQPPPAVAPAAARPKAARVHEPTERLDRSAGTSDDDELDFDPRRKSPWPLAAAAAAAAVVIVLIIVGVVSSSSSTQGKPTDVDTGSGTVTGALPNGTAPNGALPNGTAPNGTAPNGTAPNGAAPNGTPNGTAPNATGAGPNPSTAATNGHPRSTGTKPHATTTSATTTSATTPATTTTNPTATTATNPGESHEATRARDRVETLKRSACKDPCVGRIVGQLETMPGAVELDGFRTSVDACISACRAR